MGTDTLRRLVEEVYQRLYRAYGPQGWWPGDGALEVCIGAILTQAAAWRNVERALGNLKRVGALSPAALRALPLEELARLVRPSGYFTVKARKVKAFVEHLARYNDDLEAFFAQDTQALRAELLGIYGIGEETADDILLYAAGKPVFVVDAYTIRIFQRLGVVGERARYGEVQRLFMEHMPADVVTFQEYHALLVRLGKEVCRKRAPRCGVCPLLDLCPTGRRSLASVTPVSLQSGRPPG
ncbi:MAG: endonuclease III domain-containing protein [Dehalococcoidia bacterium]|nr:endonuclease III domain-containing protein [Dehalococcoidia bacterium]MDW8120338.1 endonuclease III domain-containing protein [Chloroflexota bacterium]